MSEGETRARRDGIRECNVCPSFIVRCAHLDGQNVQLMNTRAYEQVCDYWNGRSWVERGDWMVLASTDNADFVCTYTCRTVCGNKYGEVFHESKDRAAAEAAFYEAEQRLITGDA